MKRNSIPEKASALTGVIAGMLLVAGASPTSPAPCTAETTARELASAAMEKDRLPSLSVAVGVDGKVVYAEAFGFADVENGVPATPETVYRIGSVTKTLTAAATVALAEAGTLDLDAPVQQYCGAFPEKGARITPRLLLAHLGGIRDYDYHRFAEEYLNTKRYGSLSEALSIFKDDPLVAPPGTKYHYSSFSYVLLGCALEGAAGTSYEEVLRSRVLGPAGMTQTTLDYAERIVPHRARGYGKAPDGGWKNSVCVDLSDRFPAGGLLSTPRDLVAFGNALLDGRIVSPATRETMWQAQHTAAGASTSYGLGWRVAADPRTVFHGGTSVGGSAYLLIRPASKVVVAFATNLELWTGPRDELARALADAFTH